MNQISVPMTSFPAKIWNFSAHLLWICLCRNLGALSEKFMCGQFCCLESFRFFVTLKKRLSGRICLIAHFALQWWELQLLPIGLIPQLLVIMAFYSMQVFKTWQLMPSSCHSCSVHYYIRVYCHRQWTFTTSVPALINFITSINFCVAYHIFDDNRCSKLCWWFIVSWLLTTKETLSVAFWILYQELFTLPCVSTFWDFTRSKAKEKIALLNGLSSKKIITSYWFLSDPGKPEFGCPSVSPWATALRLNWYGNARDSTW